MDIEEKPAAFIPVPGVSAETWEKTDSRIRDFIMTLLRRLQALEEKLNTNSSNSSKPPSSDPPGSLPNRRQQGAINDKRSKGGQKGHKGHHRSLLPTAETDAVVKHFPEKCSRCNLPLGDDAEITSDAPVRHQIWEIPPIRAHVTEHQLHRRCCRDCGKVTLAGLPAGVPAGSFGPRLTAMIGVLIGQYRLSRRLCESLLADGFGLRVSLGSISSLEESISESLAASVEEVHEAIKRAPVVNADDTSWREDHRNAVLWNANTPELAFFMITPKKDHGSARKLLGENFDGILGVDRAKTYSFQDPAKLQSCWAHLDRHFQRMEDRDGESAPIGRWGKAEVDRFFAAWHEFKSGKLSEAELRRRIIPIRARMGRLLELGTHCGGCGRDKTVHAKTANTCANILGILPALFTCCFQAGVEPTNNSSERALRHSVQWRKTSFGSRAAAGTEFVARMLTVVETCRRQGRNILDFVSHAITAKLNSMPSPTLVPVPSG